VTDHKLLEDIHEESLQILSQIKRVLVQPSEWAFEDFRTHQCLADYVEDVRTTEQHPPDARSIIIQHGVGFQKSSLLGKSLQAVRMMWQHVLMLSSISEYSSVPFECKKEL
jgi:hypothetical protein